MTEAPVLRAGRDEDAEGFISLIGACWAEYPGNILDVDGELPELRALATYFASQGGMLWAVEQQGRIAGMVATRPLGDGVWELCKMYMRPSLRGGGMAQRLIGTAEDFARARGGTRMKLWTDTRFDRAHRFYEKQGYVRSGPLRVLNDLSNSIEFAYEKPLTGVVVERLDAAGAIAAVPRLAEILVACVDAGASVSFLPPMDPAKARAFWTARASDVAQGKRVLLAGWMGGALAGAVMLDLDMPPNQPHRADVQKLLVDPAVRRRGLARLLMERLEAEARNEGRNLLVLDTREGDAAEALYRDMGWAEAGRVPDFARNPDGTLAATIFFWKRIAP
jgi:GNAT superfamily N-acetyltransferase